MVLFIFSESNSNNYRADSTATAPERTQHYSMNFIFATFPIRSKAAPDRHRPPIGVGSRPGIDPDRGRDCFWRRNTTFNAV